MKDVATGLSLIEDKASAFYRAMAGYFQNDPAIARNLNCFARDEESHSDIMNVVATCMLEENQASFPLQLPDSLGVTIGKTMDACVAMANAGNLTLRKLGEAIADIEFSEWNSVFFYVVNALKDVRHDCKMAAIQLQGHLRRIQQFLEQIPLDSSLLEKMRQLPPLWSENILVVDDEGTVRELLKAILGRMGNVDVAGDGIEGFEKIGGKYYALIVSDITMPRGDGIELYQKALRQFPSIRKRFLFFAAGASTDQIGFIREHNLDLIEKPARVREIITKASTLLTASETTLTAIPVSR